MYGGNVVVQTEREREERDIKIITLIYQWQNARHGYGVPAKIRRSVVATGYIIQRKDMQIKEIVRTLVVGKNILLMQDAQK